MIPVDGTAPGTGSQNYQATSAEEAAIAAAKAKNKARSAALLSNPYFWLAVGIVLVLIVTGIAMIKLFGGSTPKADADDAGHSDPSNGTKGYVLVDNSRSEQEIYEELKTVSEDFIAVAQRIAADWSPSNKAQANWAIKLVKAMRQYGDKIPVDALDLYAKQLDIWWTQTESINRAIVAAVAEASHDDSDITKCTQYSVYMKKEDHSEHHENTVTTNKGFALVAAWSNSTSVDVNDSHDSYEYGLECTDRQVDPNKLAAQMARISSTQAQLWQSLQSQIDGCPSIDDFIDFAIS